MDYQTFKTKKAGMEAAKNTQGWFTKLERLYLPDDENANKDGYAWVLKCSLPLHTGYHDGYLRLDGFVR